MLRSTRAIIAAEAAGTALIESETLGASLTFTFQGHSVDLIARKGPQAGQLLVTMDGRTVTGLPADDRGRSYLNLHAGTTVWQGRLPIAAALAPGQHMVRLTVSDGDRTVCTINAFEANAGQSPAFPVLPAVGLGPAQPSPSREVLLASCCSQAICSRQESRLWRRFANTWASSSACRLSGSNSSVTAPS